MPHRSRWSIDIPTQSLTSFLFGLPTAKLDDKPILINAENSDQYLTHHTYREWSKRLALGLQQRGFRPGDRLLLFSGNTVFFPVILQGVLMAGGIFTGANPTYVAREVAYQLQDSGATFLITAASSVATALDAASSIDFPKDRIFVMGNGSEIFEDRSTAVSGVQHWTSLLASASEAAGFSWEEFTTREQMNRTAVINYSSGTTGLPKGVEISHLNYISNIMQADFMHRLVPDFEDWKKRAAILAFLPMYHAYGQTYFCVSYGESCVVPILGRPTAADNSPRR